MSVEIENASINSVQVSINVVKIGQKQMTQAVFNQLYEEKPWDDYYNIPKLLWGKVNYKGTDYIVFQSENELRKKPIPKGIKIPIFTHYFIRSANIHINPKWLVEEIQKSRSNNDNYSVSLKKVDQELKKLRTRLNLSYNSSDIAEDFSVKDFEVILPNDLYNKISEHAKTRKWWDEKYNSLVNELNSQKQLFIAV